jgi:hypothetical protein
VFTQTGADKTKLQESVKKLMESTTEVLEKIATEGESEHAKEAFTEVGSLNLILIRIG